MTTSQSRNLRKAGAVALSLALAMSTLAITPASAAKKVKLAKTKITVNVGKTKTVKIKNVKKKQVKKLTVKSSKKSVAKAKASNKTAIKVTGKKKGSAKVTANLKLKKKVGGKKAYKMTLKVTVKKSSPATPTAAPATPTPVVTASAISIENATTGYKVATGHAVTIRAILTPANSNEEVVWASSDTSKATVSGSAVTANGVSTVDFVGVAEGEVDVTAKIANGQTAVTKLTVTKDEIYANIVSVTQLGDCSIKVDYDKDLKNDTMGYDRTKVKVTMYQADGKTEALVIPCNKEVRSADGKSATYTLDSPLTNGRHVKVEYGTTFGEFDAKVGEPATAKVLTTEAQKDVETKLEFALIDASGMDVTKTYNVNGAVTLSITGVANENMSDPDNATFVMDTVGATATATVNYTKPGNSSGTPDITKTGAIKCIPTQATVGTPHFRVGDAKVWKGDSKDVTVYVDGDKSVFFYATNDSNDAIKYDSWEAEAANKDYLSVAVGSSDSGKFVEIQLSGNKAGTTYVNIKATKNGVATPYSIPVTVKAATKLQSLSLKADMTSMSNAFDYAYKNNITATAKDSDGNDITKDVNITYDLSDKTKSEAADWAKEFWGANEDNAFYVRDDYDDEGNPNGKAVVTAYGAKAKSYTVKATATASDGTTKEATVNISVASVPKGAFENPDEVEKGGVSATYKVVAPSSVKNTDGHADVRLAAYSGSIFLGYVGNEGVDTDNDGFDDYYFGRIGQGSASYKTQVYASNPIINVVAAVKVNGMWRSSRFTSSSTVSGTEIQYSNLRAQVYDAKGIFTSAYGTTKFIDGAKLIDEDRILHIDFAVGDKDAFYVQNAKAGQDRYYALDGEYSVQFGYTTIGGKKSEDKTVGAKIKLTNDIYMPVVEVENRKVESLDADGIKDALKANVDILDPESNNASILDVFGPAEKGATTLAGLFPSVSTESSSVSTRYVAVANGDGKTVYLELNASFQQK